MIAEYMYLDYLDGNMHVNGPFITGSSGPLLQMLERELDLSKGRFKENVEDSTRREIIGMEIDLEIRKGDLISLSCHLSIEDGKYVSGLTITLYGDHPIINTLVAIKAKLKDVSTRIYDRTATEIYVYGYPPGADLNQIQEADELFDKFSEKLAQIWAGYIKKEYPALGRLL